MSKENDRALRFYHEVLGLERLHYGLWADQELTLANLKVVQEDFESNIISSIPDEVNRVLDVGCGTGIMVQSLLAKNYQAEGLSPDINQKKVFEARLSARFHHSGFEDFLAEEVFDCIIMSESSQYIKLDQLFKVSKKSLNTKGYLLVCDYFLRNNASGIMGKSGHNYDAFLSQAEAEGFSLLRQEDITQATAKTLDLAKDLVERGQIGLQIASERFVEKKPLLTRLIKWLFRKKMQKMQNDIQLLDSQQFIKNKVYSLLVFQCN